MCCLVGFKIRSPALVRPPNKMIASGLENITKLASAAPKIVPVDSKISLATVSPAIAASYTFLESI